MKNIVITLLFLIGSVCITNAQEAQRAKIIIATYSGNSTEGYYFTNDLDQTDIKFANVDPEVLKKYDLNGTSYLRKTFRVTYIKDTDNETSSTTTDDTKSPKKIIDLALVEETGEE